MAAWLKMLGEMTDVSGIEDDIRARSLTSRHVDSVLGKLDEKIASLYVLPKMDTPAGLVAGLDAARSGRYRCIGTGAAVWHRLPGPNDGAGKAVVNPGGVSYGDEVIADGIATGPSGAEYIVLPDGGFYVFRDPRKGSGPVFELATGAGLSSGTPTKAGAPPASDTAPNPPDESSTTPPDESSATPPDESSATPPDESSATPTNYDISWSGGESDVTEYTAGPATARRDAQEPAAAETSQAAPHGAASYPTTAPKAADPYDPTESSGDSGGDEPGTADVTAPPEQDSDEDLL